MFPASEERRAKGPLAPGPATGQAVDPDLQQSIRWYTGVAGRVDNAFLMGTPFDEGLDREEDIEAAIQRYRDAAGLGHVLAKHNLGNLYDLRLSTSPAGMRMELVPWTGSHFKSVLLLAVRHRRQNPDSAPS